MRAIWILALMGIMACASAGGVGTDPGTEWTYHPAPDPSADRRATQRIEAVDGTNALGQKLWFLCVSDSRVGLALADLSGFPRMSGSVTVGVQADGEAPRSVVVPTPDEGGLLLIAVAREDSLIGSDAVSATRRIALTVASDDESTSRRGVGPRGSGRPTGECRASGG